MRIHNTACSRNDTNRRGANSRDTINDRDPAAVGTGLNNRDINNDGEVNNSRAVTNDRYPTNNTDAKNRTE
jgi:hypothetical protein